MSFGFALAIVFFAASSVLAQQPSTPTTNAQSPFLPIPAISNVLRFGTELPAFEVKDISGRTWRSEDLRGKFTLIYIWHTFWARSADAHPSANPNLLVNLPELQRFYDQVRNTKNIQVLAFCNDYDYTHAPVYMKEKKYTFPVIADWVLIKKLFPDADGAPLYWLINPEGRLSDPLRAWSFGGILYEIERAAAHD